VASVWLGVAIGRGVHEMGGVCGIGRGGAWRKGGGAGQEQDMQGMGEIMGGRPVLAQAQELS
jgi:hypothetical protein